MNFAARCSCIQSAASMQFNSDHDRIGIPYGTKILHGIKFYGCWQNCKIKIHQLLPLCCKDILSCFDSCKI